MLYESCMFNLKVTAPLGGSSPHISFPVQTSLWNPEIVTLLFYNKRNRLSAYSLLAYLKKKKKKTYIHFHCETVCFKQ